MSKNKQHHITLADVLSVSGLVMIGYGLYQFVPWVSFVVVGFILLCAGIIAQRSGNVAR